MFRTRYLVFGTTLFGLLVGAFLATTSANTYVSEGQFRFTATGAEATQVAAMSAAVAKRLVLNIGIPSVCEGFPSKTRRCHDDCAMMTVP